jgi:hypothetical protein
MTDKQIREHNSETIEHALRVKIERAAQITGNTVGTLRFWRVTDRGPRSYVVGRRLWYDVADLDALMDVQKAQSVRGGV